MTSISGSGRLAALCTGLMLTGVLMAAPAVGQETADPAEAYAAEDWAAAAAGYGKLTAAEPGNGRYWYRYAVSLRQLGRYEAAADALGSAENSGVPASFIQTERARLQLAQGNADGAFANLEAAVAAGAAAAAIESDESFVSLHERPEWNALIAAARRRSEPCNFDPRFREFDFWIGEWEVRLADGSLAGANTISKEELGCTLLERWRGAAGSTGTSLNFYDPVAGHWIQHWVGAGVFVEIAGGIEDGSMRLTGHVHYTGNGETWPFRGTWTLLQDGRVRQFFEESRDEGKTWNPWFEGFYSKKTGP